MNTNGFMAFRSEIRKPDDTIRGAIFQHFGTPDQLAFLAIEDETTVPISTGLQGVDDVVPDTLGPPVISDNTNVAFYAISSGINKQGIFYTTGGFNGLRALMHGAQSDNEIFAVSVLDAPLKIAPRSAGAENNMSGGFWFDQPSINCNGDVAFRVTVQFTVGGQFTPCIVRWSRATNQYDVLFRKFDPLPPRVDGSSVIPAAVLDTYPTKEEGAFSTFSRPVINGHGEVAVVAQIADTPIPNTDNDEALLLYNRDGDAVTLARTRSQQWEVADTAQPPNTYQIRAFGSYESEAFFEGGASAAFFKNAQLNDYGQVAVSMNTYRPVDGEQRAGIGYADVGGELVMDQFDRELGSLVLSGGTAQDGDRGFERAGGNDNAFAALWVVDPGTDVYDTTHLVVGPDHSLSVPYPDSLIECKADLNRDGLVGSDDLGILIGQFGSQCPCSADLNGDGFVNSADLGLLISVFGQFCDGCPSSGGSTAESLLAGPGTAPPSPLLSELGFSSTESYCDWLDSLTPAQFADHLSDCLDIIQNAE